MMIRKEPILAAVDQTVTLRRATTGDAAFLLDLFCESRRAQVAAWGWTPEQQGRFLRFQFEALARGNGTQHAATEDSIVYLGSEPAGRLLIACQGERLFLVEMAVLDRYSDRGIDETLLDCLIRRCQTEQRTLSLEVLAGSPAEILYRRLGFRERCRDAEYLRMELAPAPTKQLPH